MNLLLQSAFLIDINDNVVTALNDIEKGDVKIIGATKKNLTTVNSICDGHKIAVINIEEGDLILKYGVPIGIATKKINVGEWVHIHNMKSLYDERTSYSSLVNEGL